MLKDIPIALNTDFFENREKWLSSCKYLIYTGPIDEYFDYKFGRLGWRSVRFELEKLRMDDFQGTGVMNYADEVVPYTRIHEPKHLHLERKHTPMVTVIIREYPQVDEKQPYYPINSLVDKRLIKKYKTLAKKEKRVIFGGRLAEYAYYDMCHTIESALKNFNK